MHVRIDEARHHRSSTCIDDDSVLGNARVVLLTDLGDPAILEDDN